MNKRKCQIPLHYKKKIIKFKKKKEKRVVQPVVEEKRVVQKNLFEKIKEKKINFIVYFGVGGNILF